MEKIASPQELQSEIRSILAYVHHSEKPDRQVVAVRLRELADRVAGEGRSFGDLLKAKYRGVKYDAKTGRGTADAGLVQIGFSESSNDDVVQVELKDIRFKLPAKEAFDVVVGVVKELRKA